MKKTNIPNLITGLRMMLSFILLFLDFRSLAFISIYLLCGITDILDGFTARKMHCQSSFGAMLDSIADLLMCGAIVVTLIRQRQLSTVVIIGIILIFDIRIISIAYSKSKFKKASSIHTTANKLTGLLFFFCPLTYGIWGNRLLLITGVFAFLSAVEELLILRTSKKLDLNRKSIFLK